MEAESVKEYRRLASYNGVVFAAMEDEKYGFMFTTWNETADRKYVSGGDYSSNYDYVKEVFATRAGLIDKQRLFNDEQLGLLLRCLNFTAGNDEQLTCEQARDIKELEDQIGDLLPPDTVMQKTAQALQQNM